MGSDASTSDDTSSSMATGQVKVFHLIHLYYMVGLAYALLQTLSLCTSVMADNVLPSASAEAKQRRLYEQLCDVTLERAMTAAVRFVQSEVWPVLAEQQRLEQPPALAPAASAAVSNRRGQQARPGSKGQQAPAQPPSSPSPLSPAAVVLHAAKEVLSSDELASVLLDLSESAFILMGRAAAVTRSLTQPIGRLPLPFDFYTHGLGFFRHLRQAQQLKPALRQRNAISAICSALLAAPPPRLHVTAPLPEPVHKVWSVAEHLYESVLDACMASIFPLLYSAEPGPNENAMLEVLAVPEVVALQRGLLERVIEDAGGGGGGQDALSGGGSGDQRRFGIGGGGDSGTGGGSSTSSSWPLLDCALKPDGTIGRAIPTIKGDDAPGVTRMTTMGLVLKFWRDLDRAPLLHSAAPSPPERMRLALRLMRTIHLACDRGAGGRYGAEPAASAAPPGKLQQCLPMIMEGVIADIAVCVNAEGFGMEVGVVLDALEACVWVLSVANSLLAMSCQQGDCGVAYSDLLTCLGRVPLCLNKLAEASLPPDACRSLASRLGRAHLLPVLDALLRRVAASPVARTASASANGNADAIRQLVLVLMCAHTILDPLLGEVVRESWERQLGLTASEEGGGDAGPGCGDCGKRQQRRLDDAQSDPWDTKRELGFFITLSKLALREAAGLDTSCQKPEGLQSLTASGLGTVADCVAGCLTVADCVAGCLTVALCPARGLLEVWERPPPGLPASTAARLTEVLTLVTRAACVLAVPLLLRAAETLGGVRQDPVKVGRALGLAYCCLQALASLYGKVPAAALLAAQPHRLLAALGVMLGRMGAAEGVQSAAASSEASADVWKQCLIKVDIALLRAWRLLALMAVGTSGEEGKGADASGGSAGPAVSLRAHALALLGWPAAAAGVTAAAGAALSRAGAMLLEGLAGWDTAEARALRAIWRAAAAADGGALLDRVGLRLRSDEAG
ncbi:hypothetical protein Agub_g3328, partial [Astrephomene gubernaculifera]